MVTVHSYHCLWGSNAKVTDMYMFTYMIETISDRCRLSYPLYILQQSQNVDVIYYDVACKLDTYCKVHTV